MAVGYRDETPFTGDNHTPTELANAIRTKKYGKDVREPIAQAVEKISKSVIGQSRIVFYFSNEKGVNFDFVNKKIIVPAGSYQISGITSTFNAQEIAIPDSTITWIVFDTINKNFMLSNEITDTNVCVGNMNSNAQYGYFTGKYVVNGIDTTVRRPVFYFDNSFGEGKANFDLRNRQIIFPGGSYSSDREKANQVKNTYKMQTLKLTDDIGFVAFDTNTNQFVLKNSENPSIVIVGQYNINRGTAYFTGEYTVNGGGDFLGRNYGTLFSQDGVTVDAINHTLSFGERIIQLKHPNVKNTLQITNQPDLDITGDDYIYLDTVQNILITGKQEAKGTRYAVGYYRFGGEQVYLPTKDIKYKSSLLVIGNSITQGVNTNVSVTKYIDLGLKKMDIQTNVINNSVGGTAVSNGKWFTNQNYLDRITENNALGNFTNVLIHLGENEFNGSREIGEVDSTDTNTMCGGLNILITRLRKYNTKGVIFISTPAYAVYEGKDWRTSTNTLGKKLDDYINAFSEVAKRRGCVWIDNRNCGYVPYDTDVKNSTTRDGLHPNEVGARLYAGNILSKISGYIACDYGI